MEKQQTAVDWFLEKIGYQKEGQWYIGIREDVNIQDWIDQVRQMHKEQVIEAHLAGVKMTIDMINKYKPVPEILNVLDNIKNGIEIHEDREEYYKETYAQQ